MRLEVAGFFDDRSSDRLGMESDAQLIGSLARPVAVTSRTAPHRRHFHRAADPPREARHESARRSARHHGSIYYVPDIFVFDLIQARSGEIHGIPVVAMCETPFYGYRGVAKRLTDIVLRIGDPAAAAAACWWRSRCWSSRPRPGPIIFKQRRYGLDGREIAVYKFRTMHVTEDGAQIRQASKIGRAHHAGRRASCAALRSMSCRSSSMCCRAA